MTVLRTWVATRVALVLLIVAGASQVFGDTRQTFLERMDSWDVTLFIKVAQFGYDGYPQRYPDKDIEAFFPGFPVVLRAVHAFVPNWAAAGLLVSFVAGGVAMLALARLAGSSGDRAVLYLALSPYAVFLLAGYSEALFLAFALPGWYAAKEGRWPTAGLLVAGACTVRISGAFLAVALLVQWGSSSRDVRVLGWLATPFVALFAYAAYLHHLTGDWLRWQHAQADGWGRHLTDPVSALRSTWNLAQHAQGAEFRWAFHAEIVAVAVGVLVTVVLARRREWGEMTYVGLSVAALATSTYYLSVARATLLWFPLWVLLAQAAARWKWVHPAYLTVAAPLMASAVLTFSAGRWVG